MRLDFSSVNQYFTRMDKIHQLLMLEAFTTIPLPDDLENMAIFYNLPQNELVNLQQQTKEFLKELRNEWNNCE